MATTSLNGALQVRAGTLPLSALVAGYSIPSANLADGANFLKKDGSVAMTASLNLGGFNATNSAAPVNATDLANKAYIDAKVGGIGGFHDVRALAAANLSIAAPGGSIDGVAMAVNDLFIAIGQTTPSQNGPWIFNGAAAAATRPAWFAAAAVVSEGQYFLVAEGTVYKDSKFFMTTTGAITVDTTSLAFSQDLSGSVYTAGTGLNLAGGQFSANFGTSAGTVAQGNDSRIVNAVQSTALGAGVLTALDTAPGTAGSVVINGGALGTPSSGSAANLTGLPIAGIAGLGAGVATALAAAAGSGAGLATLSAGVLPAGEFPALTGDVTNTAGNLATTVNNTAGTGFTKYTNFVNYETPGGTVNGVNATFTLAAAPANCFGGLSSLELYFNGDLLESGAGNDYTISGTTITMLLVPQTGDKLRASYMK